LNTTPLKKTNLIPPDEYFLIQDLIFEWARVIDENRVEDIAKLLDSQGRYTVKSRFNHDRDLPLAVIDCHSAAQLRDRILSMRLANVYEPQHYRHIISGIQVTDREGQIIHTRSNFMVVRTMDLDGEIKVIFTGQAQDIIQLHESEAKFKERLMVFDSRVIETLLVIPL
jgi:anthranilate 1,2-dioxygenase small subunit